MDRCNPGNLRSQQRALYCNVIAQRELPGVVEMRGFRGPASPGAGEQRDVADTLLLVRDCQVQWKQVAVAPPDPPLVSLVQLLLLPSLQLGLNNVHVFLVADCLWRRGRWLAAVEQGHTRGYCQQR